LSDDYEFGFRPRRPLLGDYQLRLDPAIEAQIRVLTMRTPSPTMRTIVLTPPWSLFDSSYLDRMLATPPPANPRAPLVPRGAGPSTPRPGEVGDVMSAVWKIPAVQRAANGVLDRVTSDLQRGWRDASPGERGYVIGWGVVTVATLTPLLMNTDARMGILRFLEGKDIPVPGVRGLTFTLGPRGGGATWNDFVIPGLRVGAGARAGASGAAEWDARVMLDVAELLRRR
jgi:hypothetical protein